MLKYLLRTIHGIVTKGFRLTKGLRLTKGFMADKGFKMASMMNKLASINSCEIILEK